MSAASSSARRARRRPTTALAAAGLVLAAAGPVLAGCGGVARSLGSGAVAGATDYARSDSGRAAIGGIADSTVARLDSAIRVSVLPTVDTVLSRARARAESTLERGEESLLRAEEMLLRAEDSLAVALRDPLSEALRDLVRRNVETAGVAVRGELALLSGELRREVDESLTPAFTSAITAATEAFMAELSRGVREELSVAMEEALVNAVRSAVDEGGTSLWDRIRPFAFGAGAVLVLLVGWWLYRERQKSRAALAAVTAAIDDAGDPRLKERVHQGTASRGVDDWYRGFVRSQGRPE